MTVDPQEYTLDYVNSLRLDNDFEPLTKLPKGERGNSRQCPVARALPVGYSLFGAALRLPEETQVPLPMGVQKFIARFDNSEYPELIDA